MYAHTRAHAHIKFGTFLPSTLTTFTKNATCKELSAFFCGKVIRFSFHVAYHAYHISPTLI